MRNIYSRTSKRRAFTLVEVVVAIAVVGVGVVSVMATVSGVTSLAAHASDTVLAGALAQDLMAQIDTRPFHTPGIPLNGRIVNGVEVYYPLEEGSGSTTADKSENSPAVNISLGNGANWIPGSTGVTLTDNGELTTSVNTARIRQSCVAANAFSLEIWFEPADFDNSALPLISFGQNANIYDFIMAQRGRNVLLRLSGTSPSAPEVASTNNPLSTSGVNHCIATFDGSRVVIYVNGVLAVEQAMPNGIALSGWNATNLRIGRLPAMGSWSGRVFLAVIYHSALNAAEVEANLAAGPAPSYAQQSEGYNDISDYNGYADAPPLAEGGSVIPGAEQFSRTVEVVNVLPTNPLSEKNLNTTDAKRITVTVYRAHQPLVQLVRVRYRGASPDDRRDYGF